MGADWEVTVTPLGKDDGGVGQAVDVTFGRLSRWCLWLIGRGGLGCGSDRVSLDRTCVPGHEEAKSKALPPPPPPTSLLMSGSYSRPDLGHVEGNIMVSAKGEVPWSQGI